MLEFKVVLSSVWINGDLEILQMAAVQGQGEQGVVVGPARQHLPDDIQNCSTQMRSEFLWCQPPPGDHQASL